MARSKKIVEGSCFKLRCTTSQRIYVAREMKFGVTSFYYFPQVQEDTELDALIPDATPIYSNFVHKDVYKEMEFLKVIQLSKDEESFTPKFFRQDFTNIEKSYLIIAGQLEPIPCKPEDCIGLERATIHESIDSICEKLEFFVTGKKQKLHELYRLRIPGIDEPFDFSKKLL